MVVRLIRQLTQPKMLLLGAVIIGILYLGGFMSFLTIFSWEKEMQWQGLQWAHTFPNTPSTTADTLSLSAGCGNGKCGGYIRSDFDLSKYSQIDLRYSATASAYAGTSSSACGVFAITLDSVSLSEVVACATESGGTNIPSATTTKTGTVTLKKESGSWNIYDGVFKIASVANTNPALKMEAHAHGTQSGSGGSISGTVQSVFKLETGLILAPSNTPIAPSLSSLISVIKDWIKRFLDAVPFLSIAGAQSPVLGSTQTYQVALIAPLALDATFADGTYAVRYCNTALVKADGTILTETGFETCTDTYSKAFTVKLPSQSGQYAVIAVMAESKGTYATTTAYGAETSTWTFAPYEVIAKDALDITTKAPIPGASDIPTKPSGNFLTNLLKALFGWLPFFR